jgi:hypothetical protein
MFKKILNYWLKFGELLLRINTFIILFFIYFLFFPFFSVYYKIFKKQTKNTTWQKPINSNINLKEPF